MIFDSIEFDNVKISCLLMILLVTCPVIAGQYKDACYGASLGAPSYCEGIQNRDIYEICIAGGYGSQGNCVRVQDTALKMVCEDVAVGSGRSCDELKEPSIRIICTAGSFKMPGLCEKIAD
jgi:hypothetical protein